MTDFEIVPDLMRDKHADIKEANQALLDGKTIFVPLVGVTARAVRNRANQFAMRKQLRLRTYHEVRDGVEGLIMWAEPKDGAA